MSYTRKYNHVIDVPVEISLSDPFVKEQSSSHGHLNLKVGNRSFSYSIGYSGGGENAHFDVPHQVAVNVEVDTDMFDDNVTACRATVDGLTDSVVATEVAEVGNIQKNSLKIGQTVVNGFFKLVKSDISAQIMEYTHAIESKLMLLTKQADELKKKQNQMQNDYQRTASRYVKIIQDINKELENRVKALDMPIYKSHEKMVVETNRMLNGDFVDLASVSTQENAVLLSQIQCGIVKKHVQELLSQTQDYLKTQYKTDITVKKTMISGIDEDACFYLPVCFSESVNPDGSICTSMHFDQSHLEKRATDVVYNFFIDNNESYSLNEPRRERISAYINTEMMKAYSQDTSEHAKRVKDIIVKLFNT